MTSEPDSQSTGGRLRKRLLVLFTTLLLLLGADVLRAPEKQWTARFLIAGISLYQQTGSKLMPKMGVQCRFEPTCSHYAKESIRQRGVLLGGGKAAGRILRCGPWTEAGTVDPP